MAWLIFKRSMGKLLLMEGTYPTDNTSRRVKMSWIAHNEVDSSSNGIWPKGIYRWSHYLPHLEMGTAPKCHRTKYGCHGIHVFRVPTRDGMGIHAGRTSGKNDELGGMTMGCIRVPANAIEQINTTHNIDPLEYIVITD
jgi:hypothetical protein